MILGITGGMGCGKSTATQGLEKRGFRRLDSDLIVREEILTDPMVVAALESRYGEQIASPRGIDRAALAERIFKDDAERLWLEQLTHPRVFDLWRRKLGSAPKAHWAIEVPLLFEQDLENWFDFTVCVACTPAQQLARLEQRGLNRALAKQRISKQLQLALKIERSDFVLWNEGSAEFLQIEIDRLIDFLSPAIRT